MSFDLYFLPAAARGRWDEAIAALEVTATEERDLSEADLALWRRLVPALKEYLPAAEAFAGAHQRELRDHGTGIQISLFPGELSLSVPYWYDGPQAEAITDLLRQVAQTIEQVSALVAYDPQVGDAFLDGGEPEMPPPTGVRPPAEQSPDKQPWWRRLLR